MKTLVTGGAGFTGRHLVERLRADGHEVCALDRPGAMLEETRECGATTAGCDLRHPETFGSCFDGVEVVFHVAALASPWGRREDFWAINIEGTENVLRAARRAGARRLVMVSSTAAVFDGWTHHRRIDETFPYPRRFLSPYSESKSISERIVLAANSKDLETVAVRPHLIWGPRDQTFLGRLKQYVGGPIFHIGGGLTETDTTWVENLVDALVLAADAPAAPGNAYFVTNDQPLLYRDFLDRYLQILNSEPAKGSIPTGVAYAFGTACELVWKGLRLKSEPMLSRYKIAELAYTHTYRLDKAKRDLGYCPRVNNEEGFKRLASWLQESGAMDQPARGNA